MSLVFEDDFDTLNTDVWRSHPWYEANVNPASMSVADSVLTLTLNDAMAPLNHSEVVSLGPRNPAGPPFYPNALRWQEGYFEARIRYTNDPKTWPSFWMLCYAHPNAWPGSHCPTLRAEWDIMENGLGGVNPVVVSSMNLHRNNEEGICGEPKLSKGLSRTFSGTDLSDWHVWGGLWKDGRVTQYLDGVPVMSDVVYDSFDQPMYLILYVSRHTGAVAPEYTLKVDWVRVWQ